jgi:hypothetical protein
MNYSAAVFSLLLFSGLGVVVAGENKDPTAAVSPPGARERARALESAACILLS